MKRRYSINAIMLMITVMFSAAIIKGETVYSIQKRRVAVMDFTANNTEKAYGSIVRNQVEVALYRTNIFEILERDKIELILKEQGLQVSGCTDTSCAVEIGKLLSVDYVVVGSIDRLGGYMLTLKFVDIGKGVVNHADSESAELENNVPSAINKLANRAAVKISAQSNIKDDAHIIKIAKKEPEEVKYSNPFTFPGFGLMGMSLVSLGGGYYFDMRASGYNDDYNSLIDDYRNASTSEEVISIQSKMDSAKDNSDKNLLYRNISYGIGGVFFLVGSYFLYKYFTYEPVSGVKESQKETRIIPVAYAGCLPGGYIFPDKDYFFGGGIFVRF